MKDQHTIQKNRHTGSKAFTLVEALVAISILMIAIATPMTIAEKGLADALLSKDEMTAAFLAQDGIEAVKNIRDQVALNATAGQTDWFGPLDPCVCTGTSCTNFPTATYCNIDTTVANLADGAVVPSSDANVNPLLINDTGGSFLKYDLNANGDDPAGTASKFYRYINIVPSTTNPNEAEVNVEVAWSSPLGPQSVLVQDFIYNYSENIND